MRVTTSSKRISSRGNREDGDATKARIIEAAGRMFAKHGYAKTTCKEICEEAKTNITGVNYHFGSREGLYQAVIKEMQNYLINSADLNDIIHMDVCPKEKLDRFIDILYNTNLQPDSWQVKLWARDIVAPSGQSMESPVWDHSRFLAIRGFISEITGIPPEDPALEACYLNVMATFMVLLIIGQREDSPHSRFFMEKPDVMVREVKEFIFAGLSHFAAKYTQKENPMSCTKLPT